MALAALTALPLGPGVTRRRATGERECAPEALWDCQAPGTRPQTVLMFPSPFGSVNSNDLCPPGITKEVIKFRNVPQVVGEGLAAPSGWASASHETTLGCARSLRLCKGSEGRVQEWSLVSREQRLLKPGALAAAPLPARLQRAGRAGPGLSLMGNIEEGSFLASRACGHGN